MFLLGPAVARDPEPDQCEGGRGRDEEREQDGNGDHEEGGEPDQETERPRAAFARPAPLTRSLTTIRRRRRRRAWPAERRRALEQEPGDQADHRREQGHPAARRALQTGRAGEHPDRDADSELGENVHCENLTGPAPCVDPAHFPHGREAAAAQRRRSHTSVRDIARYAGLFAQRTGVMRSSAMRDLMEITARPEVISLAGGLPDTSTFPPESFAAQMTRIAQESAAEALQYGPTEGFGETKE